MKLEYQVCSLELAKKLKELGVKQESLFWWTDLDPKPVLQFEHCYGKKHGYNFFSAFTVGELGNIDEMWSWVNEIYCRYEYGKKKWIFEKQKDSGDFIKADTEANVRAKCLIYLIENNLISSEINNLEKK